MILVVNNLSGKINELKNMLKKLGVDFEVRRYNTDIDPRRFSGIILTGRATHISDTNRFNSRIIRKVEEVNIPLLGICYGGEIVATTFGGSLIRLDESVDGFLEIEIKKENKLTQGRNSLEVYCRRRFQVAHLPDQLMSLSGSKKSSNEIIKHRDKEIYGLQFHPEVSNRDGQFIMENFLRLIQYTK